MAGMLGRTYLYMHNPAKAVEWLELIIAKEPALYKMADNYEDCFDDKFDNTSERVWEVQYMGGSTGKALGISQTFNSMLLASSINLERMLRSYIMLRSKVLPVPLKFPSPSGVKGFMKKEISAGPLPW